MAEQRLHNWFRRLALYSTALALAVVVLGAYTRLSDAGLGCPDWPGCYGHLAWPDEVHEIERANAVFPERPVEVDKAWKEMVHRYFAGGLGLSILVLFLLAWINRRDPGQPVRLPGVLVLLVVFQALLGMWTVTLKLKPLIVMGHLLGGLAVLSLLWWLAVSHRLPPVPAEAARLRPGALGGLAVLVLQIALGGWTSSNYAALACPDFPTCQSSWWPPMDFREGFVLWRGIGVNYEYGVLEHPARTAIHFTHRIGALVTALYLGALALGTMRGGGAALRGLGGLMLALLLLQLALGISNVLLGLPLAVAVLHNAVAALLLLTLLTLIAALAARGREAVDAS